MTDVYTYIRENYFKPISLEKISKIAKMSPFAFSRYFKKNCGAGFIEYLNRVRTNKACYLLRETEYQVHDIAAGMRILQASQTSISNSGKLKEFPPGITGLSSNNFLSNITYFYLALLKISEYGNDIA